MFEFIMGAAVVLVAEFFLLLIYAVVRLEEKKK